MKYMLMICRDEPAWDKLSTAERQQVYLDTVKLSEELTARGQYLGGHPLHPSASAASVRVRDGKPLVTDGPFVESKEKVGGLFILEARDLNEAIRVASLHPAAHLGEQLGWAIEIRPIADGCHQ